MNTSQHPLDPEQGTEEFIGLSYMDAEQVLFDTEVARNLLNPVIGAVAWDCFNTVMYRSRYFRHLLCSAALGIAPGGLHLSHA